jgi:hypothetical protein
MDHIEGEIRKIRDRCDSLETILKVEITPRMAAYHKKSRV